MKKLIFTFSLCSFAFLGFSQNPLKVNPQIPTSPIMLDYLKNYQDKNSIAKIELPPVDVKMDDVKKSAKEMANIDNLTIVKPNLAELIKMPTVKPDENQEYQLKVVGKQVEQTKPIK